MLFVFEITSAQTSPTLKLSNATSIKQVSLTTTADSIEHLLLFGEATEEITDLRIENSELSRTDGQSTTSELSHTDGQSTTSELSRTDGQSTTSKPSITFEIVESNGVVKTNNSYSIAKDHFLNVKLRASLADVATYQVGLTLFYANKTESYLIQLTRTAAPKANLQFVDSSKIELNCKKWVWDKVSICKDNHQINLKETTGKSSIDIKPQVSLQSTDVSIEENNIEFTGIKNTLLTISAGETVTIVLSIKNPHSLRSGKYTGQIQVKNGDGNLITRDIELNIKHGWFFPALVLIIGIGLSFAMFQYQASNLEADKAWLKIGQLRKRLQNLPDSPEKAEILKLIEKAESYLLFGNVAEAQTAIKSAIEKLIEMNGTVNSQFLDPTITKEKANELLGDIDRSTKARRNLKTFHIASFVIVAFLLYITVFQEVYINNPSFGSGIHYAQLLFAGFVADVTRQSVIGLRQKLNLNFPQ